jgi:ribonuclease HI
MEQVYENHMKICTDESLKDARVGYAVITPESTIKERMSQETTIFSAEQDAVIKAIYFAKKNNNPTLIATDSLSTLIATEGSRTAQNPKTRRFREQLDQTNGSIKLIWIPSYSGITGNETVDEAAKKSLEQEISENELCAQKFAEEKRN